MSVRICVTSSGGSVAQCLNGYMSPVSVECLQTSSPGFFKASPNLSLSLFNLALWVC